MLTRVTSWCLITSRSDWIYIMNWIQWQKRNRYPKVSCLLIRYVTQTNVNKKRRSSRKLKRIVNITDFCFLIYQTTEDMLSKSPRCNDMVADSHFPLFFSTPIQCEIARRFPRGVVKVGLNVQCKNISILSWVQPWTSTDLKLSYFNT